VSWPPSIGELLPRAEDAYGVLDVAECSPYPEKALFVDADEPYIGADICRATDEGRAVVLVSPDGSTRTLVARR
jgi:hypothetical protein